MEEAIWVLAPIAVAVLMYLLDHRAARRHEHFMDDITGRVGELEKDVIRHAGAVEVSLAIYTKSLEFHLHRIEALEGTDVVPKEAVDRTTDAMTELRTHVNGLAQMYHEMDARVEELARPKPARRRKAE